MFSTSTRSLVLACAVWVPCLAAACEHSEPTAVDPAGSQPSTPAVAQSSASVEFVEFGPISLSFPLPVPCLSGTVLVSGTVSGWDRIVTRSDGSLHVTRFLDVSNTTIGLGGQLWTAGPNESEIFVQNFPAVGGVRQAEHVGKVIFWAEEGTPGLQFVHEIHLVRLPSGQLQLNSQVLEVRCIAPNP